jgi:hypothetical protein
VLKDDNMSWFFDIGVFLMEDGHCGVGSDGWDNLEGANTSLANESSTEAPQKMRIIIEQIHGILHLFLLENAPIKRKIGEVKDEGMNSISGELCLFFGFLALGGDWNPYNHVKKSFA